MAKEPAKIHLVPHFHYDPVWIEDQRTYTNRAFELVPRSRAEYDTLEPEMSVIYDAFTAGINYYVQQNPQVKPRLITNFEPWMVMAVGRQILLEFVYRYTHLSGDFAPRSTAEIWTALRYDPLREQYRAHVGSNAWAIAGSRTKSGRPNPPM